MDSSDIKSYLFNCQLKKRWLHNIVYCIFIAITALKCEIVASSLKILNLQEIPIAMQTVELGIICSDSCSPSSKIKKIPAWLFDCGYINISVKTDFCMLIAGTQWHERQTLQRLILPFSDKHPRYSFCSSIRLPTVAAYKYVNINVIR